MKNSARIALLLVAAFLATAALADEDKDVEKAAAERTETLEALLETTPYAPEWYIDSQLALPVEEFDHGDAMTALEFREESSLARLARLRTLSFLTLANSGKSRLFLGVDENGFVGLHYRAVSAHADSDYRELARLPHVDELEKDTLADR